jgi:hypothetical protein
VYQALQDPEVVPEVLPGPQAARRDVRLRWDGTVLRVRATWVIESWEPAWWARAINTSGLRVERATWNGRPAVWAADDRGTWVLGEVAGRTTLTIEGTYDGDPTRGLTLDLEPALAGTVAWDPLVGKDLAGLEGRIESGILTASSLLLAGREIPIVVGPPVPRARDRRTLAQATVGIGLTVGDGTVEGRARVVWRVRQGQLTRVAVRVSGVGADLSASGPQVARSRRVGDRLEIDLLRPETGEVAVDLRWSTPVPAGEIGSAVIPVVQPEEVIRSEVALQIARDGEIEVVPELSGWTSVAVEDTPTWGEGLIAGVPTAAYTSGTPGRGGSLGLFRYVPVSGPPVVVDVAAYTAAVSPEGRALTRVQYTVRNERASHLRVEPPPGTIIVGARVQDGPITPVSEGAAWLLPLPRSLETIDGLLSFPVELVLLSDGTPWLHKEERPFLLPKVDAPVAVNRVTVHLPRGWAPEGEVGERGRVEDFTEGEGLAYGFGLGDEGDAEADRLWQEAQSAYMKNEFDKADALLDDLQSLGAANENLGKLRSNLDVVQGRSDNTSNAMARRVVDQAKSRSLDEYREQEEALKVADEKLAEGDYAAAEAAYNQAWEMSNKLKKLEQKESVEQKKKETVALENRSRASGMKDRMNATSPSSAPAADQGLVFDDLNVLTGTGIGSGTSPDDAAGTRWDDNFDADRSVEEILGLDLAIEPDPSTEVEFSRYEVDGELSIPPEYGELGAVEGGVVGGVVGGVAGGALGGVVAPAAVDAAPVRDSRATTRQFEATVVEEEGEDLTVAAAGQMAARSVRRPATAVGRGSGMGGPARKAADPAPPPPPEAPPAKPAVTESLSPVAGFGGEDLPMPAPDYGFESLEVTSTRLSVVIPALGETVKYQHLLLPENAEHSVVLAAKAPRSTARSVR